MDWNEIYNRLEAIPEYTLIYAELKSSGSFEGTRHYQLPTFEYYYQNCVLDKGGKYDFTMLRYGNSTKAKYEFPVSVDSMIIKSHIISGLTQREITISHRWNYWMGTEFGRVEKITIE